MSMPLLVEFFNQLPDRLVRKEGPTPLMQQDDGDRSDDPTGGSEPRTSAGEKARARAALGTFKKRVLERYNEGTLVRLLQSPSPRTRQAAAFALGLAGSMEANTALAACLHDEDPEVPYVAAEALWALWFRAQGAGRGGELQRLAKMRDREKALAGIDRLVEKCPEFAEAYNQRAILHFHLGQFDRSVADCEKALKINPHHFGAQAGLGQCLLKMRKQKAALKAFRQALHINPHLDGVAETVRQLESALGEEGR